MMVGADRVALNIIFEGLVFMVLSNTREKYLLQNNIPNSRLECKNYTLFMYKMATIEYSIHQNGGKSYLLGPHIPIEPM